MRASRATVGFVYLLMPCVLGAAADAFAAAPGRNFFGAPVYSMGFAEACAMVLAALAGAWGWARGRTRALGGRCRTALAAMVAVGLGFLTLTAADVGYLSWRAAQLCRTDSGLRVHRTAQVAGFLGTPAIAHWAARGFEFVEDYAPVGQHATPYRHYTLGADGPVVERRAAPQARYRYSGLVIERAAYQIERHRRTVADIASGEVLGELRSYAIYPGYFDRFVLAWLPGAWRPWTCGEEAPAGAGQYDPSRGMRLYSHGDLIEATLRPLRTPDATP